MGQEIPAPAFNAEDFTPASASGKVLARLPRSMHRQLTARAKTEGVSLNALVLAFIAEGLGRRSAART
jgi:predicted HicB family RNase H-like nuclease